MSVQVAYNAVFEVHLSQPAPKAASVQWRLLADSAIPETDYEDLSGTVPFAIGEDVKQVFVPVRAVGDDPLAVFRIELYNPVNCLLRRNFAQAALGFGVTTPYFYDDFASAPGGIDARVPMIGYAWDNQSGSNPEPTVAAGALQLYAPGTQRVGAQGQFRRPLSQNVVVSAYLSLIDLIPDAGVQEAGFTLQMYKLDGTLVRSLTLDYLNERVLLSGEDEMYVPVQVMPYALLPTTELELRWDLGGRRLAVYLDAALVTVFVGSTLPAEVPDAFYIESVGMPTLKLNSVRLMQTSDAVPAPTYDSAIAMLDEFDNDAALPDIQTSVPLIGNGAWLPTAQMGGIVPGVFDKSTLHLVSAGPAVGGVYPLVDDLADANPISFIVSLVRNSLPTQGELVFGVTPAVTTGTNPGTGVFLRLNFANDTLHLHTAGTAYSAAMPEDWRLFITLDIQLTTKPGRNTAAVVIGATQMEWNLDNVVPSWASMVFQLYAKNCDVRLPKLTMVKGTPLLTDVMLIDSLDVMYDPGERGALNEITEFYADPEVVVSSANAANNSWGRFHMTSYLGGTMQSASGPIALANGYFAHYRMYGNTLQILLGTNAVIADPGVLMPEDENSDAFWDWYESLRPGTFGAFDERSVLVSSAPLDPASTWRDLGMMAVITFASLAPDGWGPSNAKRISHFAHIPA